VHDEAEFELNPPADW